MRKGCAREDRCRRLTRCHEPATGPFSGLAGGKRGSRGQSPVRGAAEGCSGPAQRFETTYGRASENFHWPLSINTGPGNPRGEHNDGNNGAAQGSKPNRGLAPVTASGLLPREDDAVRPQCANGGHSLGASEVYVAGLGPLMSARVRPMTACPAALPSASQRVAIGALGSEILKIQVTAKILK